MANHDQYVNKLSPKDQAELDAMLARCAIWKSKREEVEERPERNENFKRGRGYV